MANKRVKLKDGSDILYPQTYITNILTTSGIQWTDYAKPSDLTGAATNSGSVRYIDRSMISAQRGNHFEIFPASAITFEYSIDSGTTWIDYGNPAAAAALFNSSNPSGIRLAPMLTNNADITIGHRSRVTLDASVAGHYSSIESFYIWMNTSGSTVYVLIEYATKASPDTFMIIGSYRLNGWSGPNVISGFPQIIFGNNTDTQYRKLRFTFFATAVNTTYGSASIMNLCAYGPMVWSAGSAKLSSLITNDRPCTWTDDGIVYFPNRVRCADPVNPVDVATKKYVDNLIADSGGQITVITSQSIRPYTMSDGIYKWAYSGVKAINYAGSSGSSSLSVSATGTLTLIVSFDGVQKNWWLFSDYNMDQPNILTGRSSSSDGWYTRIIFPEKKRLSAYLATDSRATTTTAGLMSSTDKSKLDGIAANANNYALPIATASTLGGIKVGYSPGSATNAAVQLDSNNKAYVYFPYASSSSSGLMTIATYNDLQQSLYFYSYSLATNGYLNIARNTSSFTPRFQFRWGEFTCSGGGAVSVNFSSSFSSICLYVHATFIGGSTETSSAVHGFKLKTKSSSNFTATVSYNGGFAANVKYVYFAIGY